MNFLQRLFSSNHQLYPELKPKDRIAKLVESHILPELRDEGFEFNKTDLTLYRKVGDFLQEIWFRPSRNNATGIIVQFDPHCSVSSKVYAAWLKENFQLQESTGIIKSSRAYYVPGWNTECYHGWYDLAAFDNLKLIQLVNENIRSAGLKYLNVYSDWSAAVDCFLEDPGSLLAPSRIDFCLISKDYEKAKKVREAFWQFVASEDNIPQFSFDDMKLREKKMQELGLIKIDLSLYPVNPEELSGVERIFLTNNESNIRNRQQQSFDDNSKARHRQETSIEADGVKSTVTTFVANNIPVSPAEMVSLKEESKYFPEIFENILAIGNLRYRLLDISSNPNGKIFATAHDEGMGVIWNEDGAPVREFNFSSSIPTDFKSIQHVSFLDENKVVFESAHKVFVCDFEKPLIELSNPTKKPNLKNLYFCLRPMFNKHITAGFREGKIIRWDYDGKVISKMNLEDKFKPVAFCPAKEVFALDNEKGIRRVIDSRGNIVHEYTGHKSNSIFQFTPTGDYLVEAGFSSKIFVTNPGIGETQILKAHNTGKKGYARDYDFGNFSTNAIAISGDGKYLCVGADYSVNVLWRLDDLHRTDLIGHRVDKDLFQDGVKSIVFSKDNQSVLTASKEGTIIKWDLNGRIIAKIAGHKKEVNKAIYGNDAKTIYSVSDDLTIRKWGIRPTQLP